VRGRYVTVGNPIKLSASKTAITAAPVLGQHRDEILKELGYGDADIATLTAEGAV
jgi:formyl-CoA transferase